MYGIACCALGMLGTLATGLAIDAYGPISDNAGGVAEMAGMGAFYTYVLDNLRVVVMDASGCALYWRLRAHPRQRRRRGGDGRHGWVFVPQCGYSMEINFSGCGTGAHALLTLALPLSSMSGTEHATTAAVPKAGAGICMQCCDARESSMRTAAHMHAYLHAGWFMRFGGGAGAVVKCTCALVF